MIAPLPVPITHKSRANVNGVHARLQLSDPKPVFYFYFDPEPAAPAGRAPLPYRVTGPNQYTLARFEVKSDHREMEVGAINMRAMTQGIPAKFMVEFDFEKVSPGIYKVWPRTNLKPGEYCFVPTPGSPYLGGQLMDFGITGGQ